MDDVAPLAPPWWKKRPPRSAPERRAQARRAHARVIQAILREVKELSAHRGCTPTILGAALASLLAVAPAHAEKGGKDNVAAQAEAQATTLGVPAAPAASQSTAAHSTFREAYAQTEEPAGAFTTKEAIVQTTLMETLTEVEMTSRVALTSVEENIDILRAAPADQAGKVAVTKVVKSEKGPSFLPRSESAAPAAILEVSGTDPVESDPIECFEPSAWPQFPYFGVRVAIPDRDKLAFGTLTEVWRTIQTQEIVYLLRFDDGDIQHLSSSEATAASALAQRYESVNTTYMDTSAPRASPRAVSKAKPPKGIKRGFLL